MAHPAEPAWRVAVEPAPPALSLLRTCTAICNAPE
eukprot:CAMPEP_0183339610 /NCGR_PEP_ID=MMETSP0164_2-20130417/6472_1 /TAXON_ID=221442 /ORGANISM="Coccolithus pelagicus ssp braarudi, Strain PLY182g" /LENGTH=34 /DNA_ID= /DNA_START= /DNA_END= /DNA_ORIENTATION=